MYGALVLPGAHIGHGAIIGAGSVVRGTVPPYAIVSGNPASTLRYRFEQSEITRLLNLAWWHWQRDVLAKAEPAIRSGDLNALTDLASS